MAQQLVLGSPLGSCVALRNNQSVAMSNGSLARVPRRRACRVVASAEDRPMSQPSAAFLFSLGTALAASPVFAAAEDALETIAQEAPAPSLELPSVSAISSPASTEAVDSAVSQIIDAVKTAGGAVKSGLDVAAKGAGYVKEAADTAAPYLKKGVDVAAPYVKATANLVQEVSKPVLKAAGPVVQSGVNEVEQFLTNQGLNAQSIKDSTKEVTQKAGEAINYASPTVKSTAGTLSATSPTQLAEYALGLLAIYYVGPPVLKGVFGSLRGFRGEISPAAALDAASNDGNAVIVDIRPGNDKEYAGIPDIPNSSRLIELEYASVTDRKVRGQLRNVGEIERQMTVLQIASLKRVKKGTRVLLLDKNGSVAKDIAKALTARGFKKVFVISGGFNSWTASKLQTKGSSSVSAVEILGPVFGGTRSSNTIRSDRPSGRTTRYLPSGR